MLEHFCWRPFFFSFFFRLAWIILFCRVGDTAPPTFLSREDACVHYAGSFISPTGTGILWQPVATLQFPLKKQFTFFLHFETFNLRILFLNAMNPQSQIKRSDASSLPAFPQRCVVECKWRWKLGSQSAPWKEKGLKTSFRGFQVSDLHCVLCVWCHFPLSVHRLILLWASRCSAAVEPLSVRCSGEKQQPCEPRASFWDRGGRWAENGSHSPLRILWILLWLYPEHQAPLQGQARWEEALQVQRLLLLHRL